MIPARNPAFYYLATLASGGLFAFVWMYRLSNDLNTLSGKTVLHATIQFGISALTLLINIICMAYLAQKMSVGQLDLSFYIIKDVVIALSVSLFVALQGTIVILYRRACALLGDRPTIQASLLIAFMTLIFLSSLPLIQAKYNRLATTTIRH